MGTPSDLPLAMPTDDDVFYRPVIAYFTFTQNSMSQITSSNALQAMREAEQRHLQIMKGVVESLRNESASRQAHQEQEHEQQVQNIEHKALAAVNEAYQRCSEMEALMKQAQTSFDAKVEGIKAEANSKHDLMIDHDQKKKRIFQKFEASFPQTVEHVQKAAQTNISQWTSLVNMWYNTGKYAYHNPWAGNTLKYSLDSLSWWSQWEIHYIGKTYVLFLGGSWNKSKMTVESKLLVRA